MRVLVLGDLIVDKYRMCTATRLCPEGPVPVLVENKTFETEGGAGLVANQLKELMGRENVTFLPGSISRKERVFADDRLMLRIDDDYQSAKYTSVYEDYIGDHLSNNTYQAVVISDYDKRGITPHVADYIMQLTRKKIPVFVDAKHNWDRYQGAFAAFPNLKEFENCNQNVYQHVIEKLGSDGCAVNGIKIPTRSHAVRDVTGAGDCFLAAFVYYWLEGSKNRIYIPENITQQKLHACAQFANKVAGISVEYVGTHVVTKEEIDKAN